MNRRTILCWDCRKPISIPTDVRQAACVMCLFGFTNYRYSTDFPNPWHKARFRTVRMLDKIPPKG